MVRASLRPRAVPAEVITAMLRAEGPSAELRLLWLWLWSRRSRETNQIRGYSQAALSSKFGLVERAFRERIGECARFGMLTIHAGAHGNTSLYALHHPRTWQSTRRDGPVALRPPRRRASPAPVPATMVAEGGPTGGMVLDGTDSSLYCELLDRPED